MPALLEHPAKFSGAVLTEIQRQLGQRVRPRGRVLDPFAGVGTVHALTGCRTEGIELEPEWAHQHPLTKVGNALRLPYRAGTFDAIVTSPCFGNRMADHHNARDDSVRHTYKHYLHRDPSPESAAILQWGSEYRVFHLQAITEFTRVCKKKPKGAHAFINMSDHWRDKHLQPVTAWWIETMTVLGWEWYDATPIATRRQRHGENALARAQAEWVLCFERVAA